jgi:hypothetical protein
MTVAGEVMRKQVEDRPSPAGRRNGGRALPARGGTANPQPKALGWRTMVLPYLLCASIFTKEVFGYGIGESTVDLYLIGLAGCGLGLAFASRFARYVAIGWAVLLAHGYLLLSVFNYPKDILLKQGGVAALIFVGIAALLERTDPGRLRIAYLRTCQVAAGLGILQYAVSLAGVSILIKQPGRLDSLTYEPSHYAIAVAPAVYLAMRDMFVRRNWNSPLEWMLLASVMLTFSVTALLVIGFSACVLFFKRGGVVVAALVLGMFFFLFTHQEYLPEEVKKRVEASEEVFVEGKEVHEIRNKSLLSPLSNWEVACASLGKGRLLGNGIGGHFHAYHEHFGTITFFDSKNFAVNAIGGHSLFIRMASELGLLGLGVYLYWIWKGAVMASRGACVWWTLSAVYFVGRGIKLGGFFEIGMPIFVLAPLVFYAYRSTHR